MPWSDSWSWSLTLIIGAWLIRIVMLIVVVSRKTSVSTCLAWLAIIYFQPWIGLTLYLLIGENRLGHSRARLHARHAQHLAAAMRRVSFLQPHIIRPTLDDQQQYVAYVAENLGGLPIVGSNHVDLIADSDALVDRLVADIDAAQHHVHLLYYIFMGDAVGQRVGQALERASARGVTCRVLVDAVGSRQMFRQIRRSWRPRGERITVVPALRANLLRRRFARLDLRNHRKLAIIDGHTAYTGSQNIVRPDYGFPPHRRIGPWRDISARITGPAVAQFQAVFVEDWDFATNHTLEAEVALFPEPLADGGSVALQAVPSGPNFPTLVLQDVVVQAIHAARRRVIITTPYFVPDDALLAAMRLACMRGVKVELVVPRRTNHPITDIAGRFYFAQLLEAGVHIHLHDNGLLHAKTLTIDDRMAMLGSANFDVRSFHLNFELNTLLYDANIVAELRTLQRHYIQESQELTHDAWEGRSDWSRLGENLAKLLSPLL